jgi:hypothetical protein
MRITHVFSLFGACAAIALAAAACDDGHRRHGAEYDTEDICAQYATCDTCTPQNGCGWCFDGTKSFCGSDANQCTTDWTWESNYCRAAADASVSTSSDDASSSATPDASEDANGDADVDAAGDD